MKNDILEIITQYKYDHISSEQAVFELLDLFGVVGQSEQLVCDHQMNDFDIKKFLTENKMTRNSR